MTSECRICGNKYEQIGRHWAYSQSCSHPKLSKKQRKVVKGLLMSDGTVSTNKNDNSNPRLQAKMTNKNYLKYLNSKIFPKIGTQVKLVRNAEESLKDLESRNFRTTGDKENYSDIYAWHTSRLPALKEFLEWYSSGKKVFPEDLKLTPTTLKHWYVGDGNYSNKNGKRHIQISMSNERENKEKIEGYFRDAGLPTPNSWNENQREDGSWRCSAVWNVSESQELFDYMGEPIKGFGYKW